jgi:type IV pilus assembly protein PilB
MKETTVIERRFQDEWIVRTMTALPGVGAETVLRLRREGHAFLSEALLRAGLLSTGDLSRALFQSYGIAYAEPRREDVDKLAAALLPEAFCRRRRLIPLSLKEDVLQVAMANPLDDEALADVRGLTGRAPAVSYCPPGILDKLLDAVYDPDSAVLALLEKVGDGTDVEMIGEAAGMEDRAQDVRAPVVSLVNSLISNAVRRKASGVHIEHEEDAASVRYRIDGVLRHVMSIPRRRIAGAVIARLKIMAELDIADHMRPQDGRAALRVGGHDIGLRISTLPTQYGEKAVIRLLDRRSAEVPLAALGFPPEQADGLRALTRAAQGLVIVTGPTGSGKTTTLYSLLNLLRGEEVNIVTIEDPVEYSLEGINQVQIHEKQGLTFAAALRSVLRQDPDVIMIGEIRDRETAEIALQAAMTGHLVLATLHANDTLSAVTRLVDMGVDAYKIGPALLAVTAQRLVRRLCPLCRRRDETTPYYKAAGCEKCGFTGYTGRLSLLEMLAPDAELRSRVSAGGREDDLRGKAAARGVLHELSADILWHLTQGDTTLEEALPYFNASAAPAAAAPEAPRPEAIPRPRILIVEDDPSTRMLLRAALTKGGCAVTEASDGGEALGLFAREGADLIVTDLQMPVLDGRELIRRLRGGADGGPPVIVLTSDMDERSQQETLEAGADDYVAKPVKPALLLARVNAALRRRGAARR